MINALQVPKEAVQQEIERRALKRQREELERNADAIRVRCKTLAGFIKEAWSILRPEVQTPAGNSVATAYVHGWHIDLLCAHLEAITFGKFLELGLDNRLVANVPPGMAKSLTVSVFWQAWEWGPCGMANVQQISTSFREDNCFRDSRRFRTLVMSEWYQRLWGDKVKISISAEGHVENEATGWRKTVPFRSLTGDRADRLVIDDPHSVDTAESDADRARAELTFRESAQNRLNDPRTSAIVLIMQRLHEKDLSQIAIDLKYMSVMLPMRFEPERACSTPFGHDIRTEEGQLLFPERFPLSVVDRDEAAMGAHAVASQHQQRPTPRGGLMFKKHWFKIVKEAPSDCRWVRGWDLAGSVKKTSAWTAGVKVGYCARERHFYIADVARDRVSNPETMIVNTAGLDGRGVEISLPQDPGAAGAIQARSLVAALVGYNVTTSPESGEKADRAIPVKSQAEAGNVSLVDGPWNTPFLDEIVKFPSGAYKDQADAMSRAFGKFVLTPGAVRANPIIVSAPLVIHGTPDTL